MSSTTKKVLSFFAILIVAYIALKIVLGLVSAAVALVLNILVPVAVLAAIGYVIYMSVGKKALGGGRRTLP